MKKFFVFLCAMFVGVVALAQTINVNWKVGDTTYASNTCEYGGTLTVPSTPPTKYGYTFQGWGPYTFLEYIESTGTQYIDIGNPFATAENKIVADIVATEVSNGYFFAAMQSSPYVGAYINAQGKIGCVNNAVITANDSTVSAVAGTTYTITIQNSANGDYLDINGTSRSLTHRGTPSANMLLFGIIYNTSPFSGLACRIKGFKTYDNGALTRNMVPAKRASDNAIGMYDTVSRTFFTNQGTDEFIAGPAK